MTYQDEEEQPLDPVMERVRKKMIRLMVISIGIMMVGLLAVLFAIIYRIGNAPPDQEVQSTDLPAGARVEINLDLPAGTRIVSSTVENYRLVLHTMTADGVAEFFIIDTRNGKLISRISSR